MKWVVRAAVPEGPWGRSRLAAAFLTGGRRIVVVSASPPKPAGALRPRARSAGLVVRELGGEVVLYDLERHRAHCLRETVAAVWRRCDGRTSVDAIARAVTRERGQPVGTRSVLAVARRMERARLLEEPLPRRLGARSPSRRQPASSERRTLLRGVVVTGGLAVLSLAVPTPEAAAATCLPAGSCVRNNCRDAANNQCCNGCSGAGRACGTGPGFTFTCN